MMERRAFLRAAVLAAAAGSARPARAAGKLGMPGPYRGRVVSVHHPAPATGDAYQREPVRQMMQKGLTELTGAPGWVDAWRVFFEPGDVVGIKVNGVGRPHVISSPVVVHHIIDGLREAGVKTSDIFVYDRYQDTYLGAGFDKWLPDGIRSAWSTEKRHPFQLDMEGYDRDHFMEMALLLPNADREDRHFRRSYVAKFVTQRVNKIINLPVLKHHQSAGVTLALKNMSHGFVNNVNRSHRTRTANACGTFIPAVVDIPVLRQKVVLQILDGVKGAYHGGPGAKIAKYLWLHNTMYFSTDPVAIDRIGWKVIDEKRKEAGMASIALLEPDEDSQWLNTQPEHIEIAGVLDLGEYDEAKIDWKKISLT